MGAFVLSARHFVLVLVELKPWASAREKRARKGKSDAREKRVRKSEKGACKNASFFLSSL